jgi:maleate isomerase
VTGLSGEARLRDAMERAGARRALTTSGALLEALQALAVGRLAVGTPYDADLTARLADFLAEAGYETVGTSRMDLGADIWRVSAGSVRELVHAVPRAGAEAIFLSCTNLPTYEVIGELEREVGVPVLSANLVSMWAALRAIDALPGDRPERLFRDAR